MDAKLVILLPVLGVSLVVTMMAQLMLEVPVLENQSNPRRMTYTLEKISCWLSDDICKGFRGYFRIGKDDGLKWKAYEKIDTFNNKYSVTVSNFCPKR